MSRSTVVAVVRGRSMPCSLVERVLSDPRVVRPLAERSFPMVLGRLVGSRSRRFEPVRERVPGFLARAE